MFTKEMSDHCLEQLPIFHNMSSEERQKLISLATMVTFSEGDKLLIQGEMGQSFCVLLEGDCTVSRETEDSCKAPIVLAELQTPAHFGEMSFFHRAPHSATVIAKTDGAMLQLKRRDFDQLVQAGEVAAYKLALNAVQLLSDRLRRMDVWVTDIVCRDQCVTQASEWSSFRQMLFTS